MWITVTIAVMMIDKFFVSVIFVAWLSTTPVKHPLRRTLVHQRYMQQDSNLFIVVGITAFMNSCDSCLLLLLYKVSDTTKMPFAQQPAIKFYCNKAFTFFNNKIEVACILSTSGFRVFCPPPPPLISGAICSLIIFGASSPLSSRCFHLSVRQHLPCHLYLQQVLQHNW